MSIYQWIPEYQALIEWAIHGFFDNRYNSTEQIESEFESAMRYAVEWWGKRLRPILTMIAYEYGANVWKEYWKTQSWAILLRAILWIEFIHCYTLVHDDLPCMDNDVLRRGKPTVWKKFSEPLALLVGDALQTVAFELLAESGNIDAIRELSRAMGDMGVVRGQIRDTFLRQDTLTLAELLRIHDEKTGIFISASLVIGGILAWQDGVFLDRMRNVWILLGRAFQMRDDILDVVGNIDVVGKNTQKDAEQGKWIVANIWLTQAEQELRWIQMELSHLLDQVTDERFHDIVDYVITREK